MPKLTIVHDKFVKDLWVIQRASPRPSLFKCGEISPLNIASGDIKGTSEEMLCVADAIEHRSSYRGERFRIRVDRQDVRFWSSYGTRDGVASLKEADDLAAQIRLMVRKPEEANRTGKERNDD